MEKNRPLVTVRVLSYNSACYIVETLESVKAQSYSPLELLVTDDGSTDGTIALCEEWMAANRERFEKMQLITVPRNTGVAANINRGFRAATGEWLKSISGDDCLEPTAIEEYVKFVQEKGCDLCVAGMNYMNENGAPISAPQKGLYSSYRDTLDVTYEEQMRGIYRGLIFPGPPMFFSHRLIDKVGGCDERFPFADEWTFHYAILKAGYRAFLLDKPLVRYRVHPKSLSHGKKRDVRVLRSMWQFSRRVIFWDLLKRGRLFYAWHQVVHTYVTYRAQQNKAFYLLLFLSPWWVVYRTKRLLGLTGHPA